MTDDASRLPVTLRVDGRRAVVVGGDFYGLQIARLLAGFGARVSVIAGPHAHSENPDGAEPFEIEPRGYVRGDLRGADIAVCTTSDTELKCAVRAEADSVGCLLYVSGAPQLSDFIIDVCEPDPASAEGEWE